MADVLVSRLQQDCIMTLVVEACACGDARPVRVVVVRVGS
jgi:hypothetical protein